MSPRDRNYPETFAEAIDLVFPFTLDTDDDIDESFYDDFDGEDAR